jgi:RluA family pseudouridine synthase
LQALLTILYEDNHLLAVDKPAGLLTQAAQPGDDNLLDRGKAYLKEAYHKPGEVFLGLCHRLDRNVSGVVLLARTSKAASRVTQAFARREVEKRYLALCEGDTPDRGELIHRLTDREGERGVTEAAAGKEARLRFETRARSQGASLLEVTLETGRKHQIRAQFALAGHPILGDPLYGTPDARIGRPALHAWLLALEHPVRRVPWQAEAPVPIDLRKALERFGIRLDEGHR